MLRIEKKDIEQTLLFVQKKIDYSKLKHLAAYLLKKDEIDYVAALVLLRDSIRKGCNEPTVWYATKHDHSGPKDWELMKSSLSSQNNGDGFRYSVSEKSKVNFSVSINGGENIELLSKLDPFENKAGYAFDVENKLYLYTYYNELDHIVSHLIYMLMNSSAKNATKTKHGNAGLFQEDLSFLALQDKDLEEWIEDFKQNLD